MKNGFYGFDRFNLRFLVPDPIKPFLRQALGFWRTKDTSRSEGPGYLEKFSLKDYFLIQENIASEALDLVVISSKN